MTTIAKTMTTTGPSPRFWDKHAERYAKRPVADEAAYQKKLEITQTYLRPDMEVLEFGCGTGSTALVHAPFVKHILAIDLSSKMIEIARGKAEAARVDNITFRRAAIDDFTAPDGSFDAILGLSILHLLADRDAVIAKVHRMLQPGGVFVSSTVCIADTMRVFKLIAPIGKFLGVFPLVKVFTTQDLEASLAAGGFAIDHHWRPGTGKSAFKSVFIVAKKVG